MPTTLSGAEFSNLAGITDERVRQKHSFIGPDIGARAVILDPEATIYTPEWLWLSTGVRGVDHAVEALCSIEAHPYCDGLALHALRLFAQALPRPDDLAARLQCQQASWLAASSIARVNYGASHGIGHVLGAFADVPHGHTSCVMLPHVLRYNERATADKQRLIAEALGRPGVAGGRCCCRAYRGAKNAGDAARRRRQARATPPNRRGGDAQFLGENKSAADSSPDDVMQILEAAW